MAGDAPPDDRSSRRVPGWVALVGVAAAACLIIGVTLIAMLQAPFHSHGLVVAGFVLIAVACVLFVLAFVGR